MYPGLLVTEGLFATPARVRAFLWCHASLVGSPSNAMVDRVGGIVAVPARRTNWTTVPLLPRLRLAVCYAQALVLFHAVVFHVILLHFVLLGLFRLLALHFVLAHIVFLSLILAHVVFHLVLLGLVLFHALGGLRGRNR